MESSKQSNKISDIVRLKQRLKKWRNQAHSAQTNTNNTTTINSNDSSSNSHSNNDNSNNNSNGSSSKKGSLRRSNSIKGITFLKRRTLSFTDVPTVSSNNFGVPSNGFPPMEARSNNSNSNSNSSSSSSNTKSNSSNTSKGITFLKRTLSFTEASFNSMGTNNGFPPKPMDEARSNNSSNNSNINAKKSNSSKGITFLKRTLSFTDLSNNVPKGFLAVQVGVEMKRFVIPTNYLSHEAFCTLLKEAEEEFGFQQAGVLRIPCEVEVFENILRSVEEKNSSNSKQGYQFNRNDRIVCGSIESQSLSRHPPSPMCR